MKKIILLAFCWPIFSYPLYAQKEKNKENSREIIIIKNGDKERKLTIETKDGEVFINGKPSSEYKDDDISVIRQKFRSDKNFMYAPTPGNFNLFDNDKEKKAFLGVTTEKVDDGAKIMSVAKGSAAEKSGLKEGDVITHVGNKKIVDADDLINAVNTYKPKEEINLSYNRNGKAENAKAILGERSFSQAFAFNNSNMNAGDFNFKMLNPAKLPTLPHQPFAMARGFGRGRLGVRIEDTDNNNGAKVTNVEEESAADKAGIKKDDIITHVNGKGVKDVNEVRKEIANATEKTSYNIKAKRNGADMNFEIKIPKKINKADL
ncbi:MAG TPA: PDZ domain-containing protein [Chitinophagaceae bacterium]|nr:PDZ domain-containing protein [Chitinophagaceae bacterium]